MIGPGPHLVVLVCALVWLLTGAVPALCAESQPSMPAHAEGGEPSSVPEAPRIPVLPTDIETEVKDVEEQIDVVLHGLEERSEEEIQELIRVTDRIFALQVQYQGEQWWETLVTKRRQTELRQLVGLSEEQRHLLALVTNNRTGW